VFKGVLNDEKFPIYCQYLLQCGNRLNTGTKRIGTAIKLEDLSSLNVKTKDGDIYQFVAEVIEEKKKDPSFIDLKENLANL
jgi:hypothetical protein